MSLEELNDWGSVLRGEIQRVERRLRARLLARLAAGIVDRLALEDTPERARIVVGGLLVSEDDYDSDNALAAARHQVRAHEKKIKASGYRDPEYDFSCHLQVLPLRGRLLALLFAEQDAYFTVLRQMAGVSPYPYWDNVDQPRGITRAQWRERGAEWREAIGPTGVPAQRGFTITCELALPEVDRQLVLRSLPSVHGRVKRNGWDWAWARWSQGREIDAHAIGSALLEFQEWTETPEGHDALRSARQEVAARLPRTISEPMLMRQLPDLYDSLRVGK